MKNPCKFLAAAAFALTAVAAAAASVPGDRRLMHETREYASPGESDTVGARTVSFLWPLTGDFKGQYDPLDGFESEVPHPDKSNVIYRVRYSTDPHFAPEATTEVRSRWAMYNELAGLAPGRWYWQYACGDDGPWSEPISFVSAPADDAFVLPPFEAVENGLAPRHPRIWADSRTLGEFRETAMRRPEAAWYIEYADQALSRPMNRIEDIDHSEIDRLENEMQVKAYMTQQSRRIIDAEEKNCEALIRAWLLTGDRRYGDEAAARVLVMTGWDSSHAVIGDFNDATLLSLASQVYDSCHDLLTDSQKAELLDAVRRKGGKMYDFFNNYVEAFLYEDHIWQMTLRITAMAALATMDALPEARTWAEYCYNMWVARMPGINADGGWHNGDSYFTVNVRTLVELPWLFSRLTGTDFFADPWYGGNIMYTMYQQPPFSKSGGNGSMHLRVGRPNANRIGYLDAMARLRRNSYAADYVRRTLAAEPEYLKKSLLSKPGDLCWFRLQCPLELPDGPGLAELPKSYVLPQTGLASGMSDWTDHRRNAWWSFRSSPYGSHSHALANQNAFNTFYGGKPLFYSSGHHIEFTDRHAMICHRGTLAHNTILPGGCTQKIGVEGYGWIPRHYCGDALTYVVGDASNAYGPVESELWLRRGRQSDIDFSEEYGWSDPHLKLFRRHIVDLGGTGLLFIYDELEADTAIEWHYRLHAVAEPLTFARTGTAVRVTAVNGTGASDAYIFASDTLRCGVTSKFRIPARDWLKNGGAELPDHSHFTAVSVPARRMAFATIIDTHARADEPRTPQLSSEGVMTVGDWVISAVLNGSDHAFEVHNTATGASVTYRRNEPTVISENGLETVLEDTIPMLEM